MKRESVLFVLIVALLAFGRFAEAQQPTKVPRIGFLVGASLSSHAADIEAFRAGLKELGYIEGKNIIIDYRSADGKMARLPDLARDLVDLKVDVIVGAPQASLAAKNETQTIPIVMTNAGDAVASGLVASLAHPGGNVTGLSTQFSDLAGKQLELLKEAFPRISRVALLWSSINRSNGLTIGQVKVAAGAHTTVQPLELHDPNDFNVVFSAVKRDRANALLVLRSSVTLAHGSRIADFAAKNRLPAMYSDRRFVTAGGLMSYGEDDPDLFRRAATYVDKILKGGKPADLPVEQPTKFDFVINLKTAKQSGLTIPQSVLYRADKVIK